jgi:hypothetical protein
LRPLSVAPFSFSTSSGASAGVPLLSATVASPRCLMYSGVVSRKSYLPMPLASGSLLPSSTRLTSYITRWRTGTVQTRAWSSQVR